MPVPDYRTLKPEKPAIPEVTEQDLQVVVDELLRKSAEVKAVARPSQKGDQVALDYSAKDEDGVLQMGGKGDRFIVGSGTLFPEVEAVLAGKQVGETFAVDIQVPADYFLKPLQGKKLHFEATVQAVEELTLPPLDDALAVKMMGEGKTVADLKAALTQELKLRRAERAGQAVISEFLDRLFQATKGDVTDAQIEQELDLLLDGIYKKAEAQGIKREDYDAQIKATGIDPRVQLKEQAHRSVVLQVALEEIFKQPEFEVKDSELLAVFEAEIKDLSPEQQAKVRTELEQNPMHYTELRHRIQLEKLYQFLES